MQNPKVTEIENKYKDITRVIAFENLTNVVVLSLDKIEEKLKAGFYLAYESKSASKVRFVLFSPQSDLPTLASEEMPIQVPDPT